MTRGLFITFEGGEGSGKTTQSKLAEEYLRLKGHDVYLTKEPGGDEISEKIRSILLNPDHKGKLEDRTELLLFCAARANFVPRVVRPALDAGKIVLCDRYEDSTRTYQGFGRGLYLSDIDFINNFATQSLKPDLTLLFDVSAKLGLSKATTDEFGTKDRMESAGEEFHKKVNAGFLKLAEEEPYRMKVIQYVHNGQNVMQDKVREILNAALLKHPR